MIRLHPCRGSAIRPALALFILLALPPSLPADGRLADDGNILESETSEPALPPAVRQRLNQHFPDKSHQRVLDFYEQHGGHFLLELDSRCMESPKRGAAYFSELMARWQRLRHAKNRNEKDYQHLLGVLQAQNDCIGMARQIRHLRETIEQRGRRGELGDRLLAAEKALMKELAQIFTAIQQHHLIELRRLESELLELQRLVRQRDVNRETIIQSQFNELVE